MSAAERVPAVLRRLAACVPVLAILLGLSVALSSPAGASTGYVGNRILNLAETRINDPYSYGAAGPRAFDCSGLVYWAATAAGERNWPRDTYAIAGEIGSRFSITSRPQRGDLAMWGSYRYPYHVELVTAYSPYYLTFGAETYGWAGRVSWHSTAWFRPSYFLHVNW